MKTVIFVLLLMTTVFTVGSFAKNGNNKNIRNIYDGHGGPRNRGRGRGVIDLSGFDVDPGFGRHNGNGKGNKKGLRRDAIRDLGLKHHPKFGLRSGRRYDSGLGNGRGLGRFPNGNDGLHLGGGNSNGRGNGNGRG
ncbi:uncharacterized protein LOC143251506 [Tachypleus tridentatus]|uniref:uncharacterized protein LOC143251506 n=1 Tax=Tachypleus tridentatus TaxID=6853 RepID=UPI003FD1AD07